MAIAIAPRGPSDQTLLLAIRYRDEMADETPEETPSDAPARRPPPPMPSITRNLMIIMAFLSIFVLFDPSLRNALGDAAGVGLTPAFGFGGAYPPLTFLLPGPPPPVISSGSRRFFSARAPHGRDKKPPRAPPE